MGEANHTKTLASETKIVNLNSQFPSIPNLDEIVDEPPSPSSTTVSKSHDHDIEASVDIDTILDLEDDGSSKASIIMTTTTKKKERMDDSSSSSVAAPTAPVVAITNVGTGDDDDLDFLDDLIANTSSTIGGLPTPAALKPSIGGGKPTVIPPGDDDDAELDALLGL